MFGGGVAGGFSVVVPAGCRPLMEGLLQRAASAVNFNTGLLHSFRARRCSAPLPWLSIILGVLPLLC